MKNINIFNLQAKDLIKEVTEKVIEKGTEKVTVKVTENKIDIYPNKKYKATFDYSLDCAKLDELFEGWRFEKDEFNFTNAIVNVNFNYSLKDFEMKNIGKLKVMVKFGFNIDDVILDNMENKQLIIDDDLKAYIIEEDGEPIKNPTLLGTKDLRNELYENGFYMREMESNTKNGRVRKTRHMIRYKRSSGKSRVGKCLFIDEEYYKAMMEWSYMGLDIDKIGDQAGFQAYIALTTSSMIGTIEIDPKSILIIDDFDKGMFRDEVMVTKLDNSKLDKDGNGKLITYSDTIDFSNNITDGQSLIEKGAMGDYSNKSMVLLRNRFFKSACFSTNIQKFFKDNGITSIKQLKGYTTATNIEDIKIITTSSSIKYMKYGIREDYISQLESTFGVVKYDKPTHHHAGRLVNTHYQLINTLQWTNEDMEEFLGETVDYITNLKRNDDVFLNHCHVRDLESDEINMSSTNDIIYSACSLNRKFVNNDIVKRFREKSIESFIKTTKKGHVLVQGNYSTLFANPLEMLSMSIREFEGHAIMQDEIYCKNFAMGEELLGSRSPHVTMGNILITKNMNDMSKIVELNKYFNLSRQIVVINPLNNNILERLSGADMDSDTMLLTNNKTLVRLGKKNYHNFLVPTSLVKGNKTNRKCIPSDLSNLDIKTGKNLIGEIVNASQILNSIYWDKLGEWEESKLDSLYKDISCLDIMSCIEIDKAKKEFKLNSAKELNAIKSRWYEKVVVTRKKVPVTKTVKPIFFQFLSELSKFDIDCEYREFDCGMDKLHKILDEKVSEIKSKRIKSSDLVTLYDLFKGYELKIVSEQEDINGSRRKTERYINTIIEYNTKISKVWASNNNNKFENAHKLELEMNIKLSKIKLIELDVVNIMNKLGKEQKQAIKNRKLPKAKKKEIKPIYSIKRKLFTSLYSQYTEVINKALIDNNDSIFEFLSLKEEKECDVLSKINLYGLVYYINAKKTVQK